MPGNGSKQPSRQAGSATVEFALVVPIFFLIIFGLVELGLVFAGYCGAEYASRVAVRYAIVRGGDNTVTTPCTSSDVSTFVGHYLWAAQPGSSTVTTTWSPDNYTGSTVTVSITLVYRIGIPFWGTNTVKVGASSQGTILY